MSILLSDIPAYRHLTDRGVYFIRCRVQDWMQVAPDPLIEDFILTHNVSQDDYLVKIGMSERSLSTRLKEHNRDAFKGTPAIIVQTYPSPDHLSCVFENFVNWLTRKLEGAQMKRVTNKKDFYVLDGDYKDAYQAFLDQVRLDIRPLIAAGVQVNALYSTDPRMFSNRVMVTPAANRRRVTRSKGVYITPLVF